jgi:hypothetical protein
MMIRKFVVPALLLFVIVQCTASQPKDTAHTAVQLRFLDQIEAYAKQDSIERPAKGEILFIGSSIFRLWKNLKTHMAPLPVFNRAFGGSHTREILLHMQELVYPHAPKIIVYYCGSNDVNANVPTATIAANFTAFVDSVKAHLPGTRIVYASINKAPQKMARWSTGDSINTIVSGFCKRTPGLTYCDINPPLFDSTGRARTELYLDDKLHFKGDDAYLGFTAIIKPVLLKAWNEMQH